MYFAYLHHSLDVAVACILLEYVEFQNFHRHWIFMVLSAAEVT